MPRKSDRCSHCGAPLGEARLMVSHGAIEGPTGIYCLPTDCYEKAWEALEGSSPRASEAPVSAKGEGAGTAPNNAAASPGPSQGVPGGGPP